MREEGWKERGGRREEGREQPAPFSPSEHCTLLVILYY